MKEKSQRDCMQKAEDSKIVSECEQEPNILITRKIEYNKELKT